jgi:hypothetical protein
VAVYVGGHEFDDDDIAWSGGSDIPLRGVYPAMIEVRDTSRDHQRQQEIARQVFEALGSAVRWRVVYIDDMQKVLNSYQPGKLPSPRQDRHLRLQINGQQHRLYSPRITRSSAKSAHAWRAVHGSPYFRGRCLCRHVSFSALAASVATGRIHEFGIPGVYGVRAWGFYYDTGERMRVTVCVEGTARSVYGAPAVGLAFDSSYRYHDNLGVLTIGYGHTQCRAMTTR